MSNWNETFEQIKQAAFIDELQKIAEETKVTPLMTAGDLSKGRLAANRLSAKADSSWAEGKKVELPNIPSPSKGGYAKTEGAGKLD